MDAVPLAGAIVTVRCMHCRRRFKGTPEAFAAAGWWQMAGPLGLCPKDHARQEQAMVRAVAKYKAATR